VRDDGRDSGTGPAVAIDPLDREEWLRVIQERGEDRVESMAISGNISGKE
jgi:hypothetical protein